MADETTFYGDESTEGKRYERTTDYGDIRREWKEALVPMYEGLDFNDSIVYLIGEIDSTTLASVVTRIRAILSLRTADDASKPITLLINSTGGDATEAYGIVDYIRSLNVKVNTVCRGAAMSGAAIILASGTGIRAASKRSIIMVHEVSSGTQGTATEMKNETKFIERLQTMMYEMLTEFTGKDKDFWERSIVKDMYLTADEAKELNIIDSIV